MSAAGMGGKAARGAATVVSAQISRIALQTVGIVILARLLSPTDYGLIAMVMVVISFADTFRDFGFSAAAIQAATLSREQRTNLFWANTGIGVVLTLIVSASAGLVAAAFHEPLLVPLVIAMSSLFTINGLATQFRASLSRSLRFAAVAWPEVVAQAVGLALAIVAALSGWEYWALVLMQVSQAMLVLVMSYVLAGWVPGLPRRGVDMAGLYRFGVFLVGSQVINFAGNNIDSIVLGRKFDAAVVGLYDRPYRLLMMPLTQIRAPSTSVALPVLSRLQDDDRRYGQFLLEGQVALGLVLVVTLGMVAGAADPVVALFLGDAWSESAPVLALLAVAAGLRTLSFVAYWVFLSRALTRQLLYFSVFAALLKIGLVIVGGQFGAVGAAAAVAAASAIEWPLSLWYLARLTVIPLRGLLVGALRLMLEALAVGLAARGAVILTTAEGWVPLVQLILAGAAGASAFGVLCLLFPAVRRDIALARRVLAAVRGRGGTAT